MFDYIEYLKTIEEFKTAKENNEKVVFVFSANWCPDCLILDKFFEETINKFPDIKFIYIDRDKFPEIIQTLNIFGIPSFVAYKNNKEVARFVSKIAKTQNEVENFLLKI
ncbi:MULTISPECIES: thioredoxin family protein [Gemella]|uniref:thioredoxin family protein n=1 Tax=Gemella TaxID=1378 RepID=UPI000767F2AC|nr:MULTISPECIES: thioredoxin family protein [Gemella]AME09844.1 thioredoxin [Gemella sp. oral taxon 928]AXI25983.1 thioredoxin [Gemella sp. ND 6198]